MARKTDARPSILKLKIVNILTRRKDGITIKTISNILKSDYKNVYDASHQLIDKGIIKKEKIGNYNICSVNYSNDELAQYLKEYNYYVALKEFKKKYPSEYNIIMENIRQITAGNIKNLPIDIISVCLVFGSYSKGEENKDSDIDILFLSKGAYSDFGSNLKKVNAPYQKKFHIVNQQTGSFIKDLKNKNSLSVAVELYKNPPIVFYGDELYFRIMVEFSKLWRY